MRGAACHDKLAGEAERGAGCRKNEKAVEKGAMSLFTTGLKKRENGRGDGQPLFLGATETVVRDRGEKAVRPGCNNHAAVGE